MTDWVGTVIGARDEEDEGAKNGERTAPSKWPAPAVPTPRTATASQAAHRRTAAHPAPRARRRESPSWALRVAAIGLLALLLITLVVILSSIL